MFLFRRLLPVVLPLLLAACGPESGDLCAAGLGEEGTSGIGACPPSSDGRDVEDAGNCPEDAAETGCEVLRLVNEAREAEGLSPLFWDASLARAAEDHARDMVTHGYFSHTSRDGRTFADRVRETDYPGHPAAENIAYGYPSAEAVMEGWMNSPGHRANILSERATDLGVGRVENHWVQVFGVR